MRWPIQWQLLVPLVLLVLVTCCLATALTSVWIARQVRSDQVQALRRTGETMAAATFPLTEKVLAQAKGLSGADFVLLAPDGSLQVATLALQQPWVANLVEAPTGEGPLFLGHRSYLVERVKLEGRSPSPGTLVILAAEDQLSSQVRQAVLPAVASGACAAIVSVLIATWLARRFATPIRRLVAQTAAIHGGQTAAIAVPQRNDEFRDLAEAINLMVHRLAAYEEQVRRHERLRSMGELAAAMGHQLRNTATGGRLALELHERQCGSAGDESLAVAVRQLRLLESHVRQFLTIGDSEPVLARERIELRELVAETANLLRPLYEHAGIELWIEVRGDEPAVEGDRDALRQLAMNLLINALDATRAIETGPRRVVVELSADDRGCGTLAVCDTGAGPPAEVQERLFQSFVTSKPNGVGLGLYCARQIAERHGGQLAWKRCGEMTVFTFEFPLIELEHGARPGRR